MKKSKSLRQQFLSKMFLVLIGVTLITGVVQLYFINQQITSETANQASLITQSINKGIDETLIASSAIERQIDLKLIAHAGHIADQLDDNYKDISNQELVSLKDQLGLAGITILAKNEGDIVAVQSTDPKDIGFSLKKVGFLEAGQMILEGKKVPVPGATTVENGIVVLPIAQSATHDNTPTFYKYAYYHAPGKPYLISVFAEAGEVNQLTSEVGPDVWIKKSQEENNNVMEIGVLTPKVFANPDLEKQIYPPMKKIVHGDFKLQSEKDITILKDLAKNPKKVSSIQRIDGKKVYQMFLPIKNDQVVYIAMDYSKLSAPLYKHSIILIVSGFISLIALFALTASFFSGIYKNIQKIIAQIKQLETGDLTAKCNVTDKGELADLSISVNTMGDALHHLVLDTHEKATQAQRVAAVLEAEANQSVEKAFSLSMEKTASARDSIDEIMDCLDQVQEVMEQQQDNPKAKAVLEQLDAVRQVAVDKTNNTTEITITLADLLKSLHAQSSELSNMSNELLNKMAQFKL